MWDLNYTLHLCIWQCCHYLIKGIFVFNVLRYHLSNIWSKHKLLHRKICVEIFVKLIDLESIGWTIERYKNQAFSYFPGLPIMQTIMNFGIECNFCCFRFSHIFLCFFTIFPYAHLNSILNLIFIIPPCENHKHGLKTIVI